MLKRRNRGGAEDLAHAALAFDAERCAVGTPDDRMAWAHYLIDEALRRLSPSPVETAAERSGAAEPGEVRRSTRHRGSTVIVVATVAADGDVEFSERLERLLPLGKDK